MFIHTAEPQAFFAPHDFHNERWLELALFPGRAATETRGVDASRSSWRERNRLFARNPKTRFIAAHFGWHANDLAKASAMLDAYPNVVTEVGAILYDIGRQPRAAHDFFVKYQDRILFGKDSFQPAEYPYYWRVFETKDEYFDYYRDYHAFWKLYGVGLPDAVLKKVYRDNALRVVKGLPKRGALRPRASHASGSELRLPAAAQATGSTRCREFRPELLRSTASVPRSAAWIAVGIVATGLVACAPGAEAG